MKKKPRFHCKSEEQKAAIRRSYAQRNKVKRIEAPYPHFRRYKKSGHPALIVGERMQDNKEEYAYRKVMHNERDGRHLNEKVYSNPNPHDSEPMHIVKRVRYDEKQSFSERPFPWIYPKQKRK